MYMLKSKVVRACAVALVMGVGSLGASAQVTAGQAIPALSLVKRGGGALSDAEFKGGVVYLDFWASWCGPCKHSFPWMNEMQAKYKDKGFKVVAINLDQNSADAEKYLKDNPASFLVAFDAKGDSPTKFKIKGMPTSYLVGPDGKVIKVHSGFRPEDKADLESAIVAALKGAGGAK
jgi:cytochrome c biogenesis protein CcmG, thiol:disulfide interchange protein DsbE